MCVRRWVEEQFECTKSEEVWSVMNSYLCAVSVMSIDVSRCSINAKIFPF